jgi:hypothetical protein
MELNYILIVLLIIFVLGFLNLDTKEGFGYRSWYPYYYSPYRYYRRRNYWPGRYRRHRPYSYRGWW